MKRITPVDVHVGQRIRQARLMFGMSQEKLGELVGITFQQIQKEERGRNRVSAGRLADIAAALGRPVAWFFEGAPNVSNSKTLPVQRDLVAEMFTAWHGCEVMENYVSLPARHQMAIASLAAQLAGKA